MTYNKLMKRRVRNGIVAYSLLQQLKAEKTKRSG